MTRITKLQNRIINTVIQENEILHTLIHLSANTQLPERKGFLMFSGGIDEQFWAL